MPKAYFHRRRPCLLRANGERVTRGLENARADEILVILMTADRLWGHYFDRYEKIWGLFKDTIGYY